MSKRPNIVESSYRLTARRAMAICRDLHEPGKTLRVRAHPRAGRNRMFLVSNDGGANLLVKQGRSKQSSFGEANSYRLLKDVPGILKPLRVLSDIDVVVLPYFPEATNLEELAAVDGMAALAQIVAMGLRVCAIDAVPPPMGVAKQRSSVTLPLPWLSEVHDSSAGLLEVISEIQRRESLRHLCNAINSEPLTLVHGDMKLDNVLAADGGPYLIDLELLSLGPAGGNLAGCISMLFVAMHRSHANREHARAEVITLPQTLAAGSILISSAARVARQCGGPVIDLQTLSQLVCLELLRVAVREVEMRPTMPQHALLFLDLAEMIEKRGLANLLAV